MLEKEWRKKARLKEPGFSRGARRDSESARRALTTAHLDAAFLHETVILSEQQVLVHLLNRVERDADDDEQRRAAEVERGDVQHVRDPDRQQRDEREEDRARQGDLRHDVVD